MEKTLRSKAILLAVVVMIAGLTPVALSQAQNPADRSFACTAYQPSVDGHRIGSTFVMAENGTPRTFGALGITQDDFQVTLKGWAPATHQPPPQLALIIERPSTSSGQTETFVSAGPSDASMLNISLPDLSVSCRYLADPTEVDLHRFVEAFLDAYHEQTLEAMQPFYNEETVLLPPTGETFRGLEGVAAYLGPRFGGTVRQQAAEIVSVQTNGTFGTIRSNTYIQAEPNDGGPPQAFAFRVMTMVKKNPDGWKVYRDLTQSSRLEVVR